MRPLGLHSISGHPHPSGNGGSRVLCFSTRNRWKTKWHMDIACYATWNAACYAAYNAKYPQTENEFFRWENSKIKNRKAVFLRHGSRGA